MDVLSISPASVRFVGCENSSFSTGEDTNTSGKHHYVVTYPNNAPTVLLAAITHELAHVFQANMSGGLSNLRRDFEIKRIELGADYITGVIYAMEFPTYDWDQFQNSLFLVGKYVESSEDAHGSPPQRTGAFRFGLNDKNASDMRIGYQRFQADEYARTLRLDLSGLQEPVQPVGLKGVDLNKLDQCKSLAELFDRIGSSGRCENAPTDALASAIDQRKREWDGSEACYVAAPKFLEGFACIRMPPTTVMHTTFGGSIECYRPVHLEDIERFREERGTTAAKSVAAYLARAAKCETSNGDTSDSMYTQMPYPLVLIAKYEIGLSSRHGPVRQPDGSAEQGYARVDESLPEGSPKAIEFLDVSKGIRMSISHNEQQIGAWEVVEDDGFFTQLNDAWKKAGAPAIAYGHSYEIKQYQRVGVSDDAKRDFLKRLAAPISTELEEEGFEEISDNKFKATTGKSMKELSSEAKRKQPFGMRNTYPSELTFALPPAMLTRTERLACTRGGRGALAAYALQESPEPGVSSDLGGFSFMIAVFGECATHPGSDSRNLVSDLVEDIHAAVTHVLQTVSP